MSQILDVGSIRGHSVDVGAIATHGAGLVAPAVALSWLVHSNGGRDLHPLWATIVIAVACAAVLRVWQLPRYVLLVTGLLVAAALLIAGVHAPVTQLGHFYRWRMCGSYVLAAVLFLDVLAYAPSAGRRGLALVVAATGPLEFAWAFTPWWAGGEGGAAMVGTFYWHNQYATYLVVSGLVGLAVALENERPWRVVGWLSVAAAYAGTIYSTSRASLALLVAASAVIVAYALVRRGHRYRTCAIVVGLAALSGALVFTMCHPPLMDSSTAPFATEQARTQGQPLSANGIYRLDFWQEALEVGLHHPFIGAGAGELATASRGYVPASFPRSPLAHQGVLQAFADGGLVLALPLLAGIVAIVVVCLRRGWSLVRRPDLVGASLVVATGAALAHSLIDFDWSYPALFALGAIVAALACSEPQTR